MRLFKRNIPQLFLVFFKIGLFTFGGGYAMIPFIQREIVENKQWITDEEMLDMFAIAESTPGVVAVNTATFVGYRIAGFWGSLVATIGVVLPAFIVISLLSPIILLYQNNLIVAYAFRGIRAGVVVLIFSAARKLFKKSPKDLFSYLIMAVAFCYCLFTSWSTIYVLLIALASGLIVTCVSTLQERRRR